MVPLQFNHLAPESTRNMNAVVLLTAVFLTAVLSAMFGMAGGLILMGVFAALLPVAGAMVAHGLVQSVSNGWRAVIFRRFVLWRTLLIYLAGSAVAAALLAGLTVGLSTAWLYIVLGCVPLLVWLPRDRFRLDASRPVHAGLAGLLVTGLNVVAGVAGPLMDVFFQGTQADRRAIVATKAATQVVAHGVKIAYYIGPALSAGALPPTWLLIAAAPLSIAGTTLGARVLDRMSDATFRNWTKRLVTGIGVVYVIRGIVLL